MCSEYIKHARLEHIIKIKLFAVYLFKLGITLFENEKPSNKEQVENCLMNSHFLPPNENIQRTAVIKCIVSPQGVL